MSQKRPQQGPNDAWAPSPEALAKLLAAKQAEADRELAASLSERFERLRFQERLTAKMAESTDLFELGRLLLRELTTTLGAAHGLLALVEENAFLETLACTQAIAPRYQIELVEEAFITGECLAIDPEDTLDWQAPGAQELPPGVALQAIPLSRKDGKPLGVLLVEGALPRNRLTWLDDFVALAAEGLQDCRAYGRIEQLIDDAVIAISSAHAARVEGVAPLHGRHVRRVEQLALQIAQQLGLAPTLVKRVRMTALLHDMEPADISAAFSAIKRGKLTERQWRAWMDDPFVGGIYPSPLATFQRIVDELAYMRCRWDGKGNNPPASGDEIPLAARVVAVAEAFDNLTGARRHRTTLAIPVALDQIRRLAGAQYDPAVVEAICRLFAALEIETRVAQRRPSAS